MALDGVFLQKLREEMSILIGCRIDKIQQLSKDEILLTFRTPQGAKKVFISTSAGAARVHFTKESYEAPSVPPMFCMLLRKHISNAKVLGISQDGQERILNFELLSANELGDMVEFTLTIEIMGRHSNLMLINSEGKIIDSIKRVGQELSSVRLVLPGMRYEAPPKDKKLSLFSMTDDACLDDLTASLCEKTMPLSKGIMACIEGISPVFAREAEFYSARGDEAFCNELSDEVISRLRFYLKKTAGELINNENKYYTLKDKSELLKDFAFSQINQYGTLMTTREFLSPSELLDYYYSERDTLSRIKQKSADLFKTVINLTERISRKTALQKQELIECRDREKYKIYGDLLMSNIYRLEKGMSEISLENFYDENCPLVTIALDKRLNPSQNAQKYYNEYKKLDTKEKMLTKLIAESEQELVYIESVFDALSRCKTESEVAALREELAMGGYVHKVSQKQKIKEPKPLMYKSTDGFVILAGRNNIQNDKLTLKQSEKTDIWLHTHNIPGSHVIILTEGEDVPDDTILQAAMIAAFNSKAKNSSQVPVDYTQVRYVKKPNGAKPGMVIFTNQNTVYVTPDEDEIRQLTMGN